MHGSAQRIRFWTFCFTKTSGFDNRDDVMKMIYNFIFKTSKEVETLPGSCFIGGAFDENGLFVMSTYSIKKIERVKNGISGADEFFRLTTSDPKESYAIYLNDASSHTMMAFKDIAGNFPLSREDWYYTPNYRHTAWWL